MLTLKSDVITLEKGEVPGIAVTGGMAAPWAALRCSITWAGGMRTTKDA